ncbi:MAG: FMN-binding protein [Vicinamibacteria bacterium]
MGRIDWHELSRRVAPLLLVAALASAAWAWRRGAERPQPDLYPFMKRAWPGATYSPRPGGGFAVSRGGRAIGHAALGTASGYGGPLTVAIGADADGRIRSAAILSYGDTPALMRDAPRFLRSLLGRSARDGFEAGRDFDAVSGATFSSRGLARAAQSGLLAVAESGDARGAARSGIAFGAPELCLVALFGASLVGRNRPGVPPRVRRALRLGVLVASLATLGVLFVRPWVIAFPIRLVSFDWPDWHAHLYWYLLLGALLLAFSRSGRGVYCPWVCPFGAAQDAVGLAFRAHRRRLPHAVLFTWTKRVLLWLAVVLGLLYRSPGAASYEVFASFFRLTGTGFQLGILAVVLAVAPFFRRPFCHWACPVDAQERLLGGVRARLFRRARPGAAGARRPVRVAVASARPPAPVFRRLRNGLLTLAGLVCALLVLGHWHERFAGGAVTGEENLMGRTFVSQPTGDP